MLLRKKVREMENAAKHNVGIINQIGEFATNTFTQLQELKSDFYELRDEIATNGVVRDLRKLEKRLANTQEDNLEKVAQIEELKHELKNFKRELGTNGVATAINELRKEVNGSTKEVVISNPFLEIKSLYGFSESSETPVEPTLKGKVDAIVQHLGLEFDAQPAKKTGPKVKVKVTKNKAGKK